MVASDVRSPLSAALTVVVPLALLAVTPGPATAAAPTSESLPATIVGTEGTSL